MTRRDHQRPSARQLLSASAVYFTVIYAAGFILGIVRGLVIAPLIGDRWAELLEMPVMLVVIGLAARVVIEWLMQHATAGQAIAVGMAALALLVGAEILGILFLRGETIGNFIATRDPVAGIAFLVMLAVLAIMPLIAAKLRRRSQL